MRSTKRQLVLQAPHRAAPSRGGGLRAELSVGFVVGLAGVARLLAGVAPVVRLRARLVMPPGRLVEHGQALEGLAGKSLRMRTPETKRQIKTLRRVPIKHYMSLRTTK